MPVLDWIGKEKVVNHHLDVPYKVLERKYSFDENGRHEEDNGSENMIIHGDNLEALKSLLPQYEGKINCIYIDPPYNTGNEKWVYNDNVNDPRIKKWLGEVVGTEGEDLSRHDKWLCMMYPRLKLLHRLLSEDGAIFISIDDNEYANLKIICDEIFGIKNYVKTIACINNPKGRSDDKYVATAHECLIIYRKTELLKLSGFEPDDVITKRYNKTDQFGKRYREIDLRKTGENDLREDRPNLFYYFYYNPDNNDLFVSRDEIQKENYITIKPLRADGKEGNWRWGIDTTKANLDKLIPKYMPVRGMYGIMEKDYLDDRECVKPTSSWTFKDINTERGTEVFTKYLGFNKSDFPKPKPVGTIERVIKLCLDNFSNGIILDSFAGSGTTAHALLNYNFNNRNNHKFILIEMMDYAESITSERIKRVINGTDNMEGTGGNFSYYELGDQLLIDNNINENVDIQKIREYVYFMETKEKVEQKDDEQYYLGSQYNTSYYFYYDKNNITTLNREFLSTVKTKSERYVIYADICTLSDKELDKYNITFKKIPRDISRL